MSTTTTRTTSWGVFKGLHEGMGIYWSGTYNVEGLGDFKTLSDAREFIDAANRHRVDAERDAAKLSAEKGEAIGARREGDNVRILFPEGERVVSIREYRQNVFSWEASYGKPFAWLD